MGGTINEDDHRFGLSAAKKYGGIFVPPHLAVIHQYMRERFAGCGKMILGSDSHTRYGALGTMAIGEGGGELAKQLLGRTYDVARPGVVAIYLTGSLPAGCGPHDVAIALVGKLFKSGYVKNKVMEFVGPGIASLRQDTRNAIDAMTTETTCLSSIWETDEVTQRFLAVHGRAVDYKKLAPADLAYYDGVVEVDLSAIRPMIALPMHPSNAFTIEELNANLEDILHACEQDVQKLIGRKDVQLDLCSKIENGKLRVDQGVIAGCAGGLYDSIYEAASILKGHTGGCGDYALSVYPGSQPIMMELVRTGVIGELMASGATIRTAFCGPCFGAGDVPANGALSIRHTTRNFPSRARREGQPLPEDMQAVLRENGVSEKDTSVGSCVFAMSPGDGSAREQAASCQRVLGGNANICYEYATKRYRSNLINWGIVPFTLDEGTEFPLKRDDYLLVKGLRKAIEEGRETIEGIFSGSASGTLTLNLPKLTEDEREILLKGCLINYYADKNK